MPLDFILLLKFSFISLLPIIIATIYITSSFALITSSLILALINKLLLKFLFKKIFLNVINRLIALLILSVLV
jgi:hypothetical protein